MNYQGVSCPVCGNAFMPEDDVVVCPECGTPHHRACYNENGGCKNAALHAEGFAFALPAVSPEADTQSSPAAPVVYAGDGRINSPEELRRIIEEAQSTADEPHEGPVPQGGTTAYDYETETIVKPGYYVPRFVLMNASGRKVLWNIMAFFFPFSWSAYRKLYKVAAICMAVNILFLGVNVYVSSLNTDMKAAVTMFGEAAADGVITDSESEALTKAVEAAQNSQTTVPRAVSVFMNLEIADNIVLGLFATYFYKRKIDADAARLKDGVIQYPEYTAALAKRGGVAILPLLIGYAAFAAAFVLFINIFFGI